MKTMPDETRGTYRPHGLFLDEIELDGFPAHVVVNAADIHDLHLLPVGKESKEAPVRLEEVLFRFAHGDMAFTVPLFDELTTISSLPVAQPSFSLGDWNAGRLECGNSGMLEQWNDGILEYWNNGMLE